MAHGHGASPARRSEGGRAQQAGTTTAEDVGCEGWHGVAVGGKAALSDETRRKWLLKVLEYVKEVRALTRWNYAVGPDASFTRAQTTACFVDVVRPKGCLWSPDGACQRGGSRTLATRADQLLRVRRRALVHDQPRRWPAERRHRVVPDGDEW